MPGRDKPDLDYCQHGFELIKEERDGWVCPKHDCVLCEKSINSGEPFLSRIPYKPGPVQDIVPTCKEDFKVSTCKEEFKMSYYDAKRLIDLYDMAFLKKMGTQLSAHTHSRITGRKFKNESNAIRDGIRFGKWASERYGVKVTAGIGLAGSSSYGSLGWDIDDKAAELIPEEEYKKARAVLLNYRIMARKKRLKNRLIAEGLEK